jgi:hypothetical protein
MRVGVKWRRVCMDQLTGWIEARARSRGQANAFVASYVQLIQSELIRSAGRPPSSFVVANVAPPTMAWEFVRGLWVVYDIQDRGGFFRRLFNRHSRVIRLLHICDQVPDAYTLSLLQS